MINLLLEKEKRKVRRCHMCVLSGGSVKSVRVRGRGKDRDDGFIFAIFFFLPYLLFFFFPQSQTHDPSLQVQIEITDPDSFFFFLFSPNISSQLHPFRCNSSLPTPLYVLLLSSLPIFILFHLWTLSITSGYEHVVNSHTNL